MDRTACVDVAALPLQALLRLHPGWREYPAAVVDRETPQGEIRWVNRHARACRIFPGMRYGAALGLSGELRAGAVDAGAVSAAVDAIAQRLWRFTPRVEPSAEEPGVFWLDASGLSLLYPSLERWAERIGEDLREAGFESVAAVGFSRFGSYAAARTGARNVVFETPEAERRFVREAPIERLPLDPAARGTLLQLGVRTLGAFLDLPAAELPRRLGPAAAALHAQARGAGWNPLQPRRFEEGVARTAALDYPESRSGALLALLEPMLAGLLGDFAARHEALSALHLGLTLDDRAAHAERLAPAAPTLDGAQLLLLLRLRIESLRLSSGVVELTLRGEGVPAHPEQGDLFAGALRRDPAAIHRAFAKIRADLGNGAVVCARLREGLLPEARFEWTPLERLGPPRPAEGGAGPLARRIYTPPLALPPRARHEPDGWLIAGVGEGPVEEVIGPQVISGGWWAREVVRAYHYVRTRSGRWLWIYHDQKRRRWFLHGEVQ